MAVAERGGLALAFNSRLDEACSVGACLFRRPAPSRGTGLPFQALHAAVSPATKMFNIPGTSRLGLHLDATCGVSIGS